MEETERKEKTLKDLINTPFKKAVFAIQVISYILIPGSPLIGAFIGRHLHLSKGQTSGVILGVFITGEILFYGSLFFLGKEVASLLKLKWKRWFKRKPKSDSKNQQIDH